MTTVKGRIAQLESAYREPDTALGRFVWELLLRSKLYAFVRRLSLELAAWRKPVKEQMLEAFRSKLDWAPNIPLDHYEKNLRRIVEIGRSLGAEVWLLTAPRNPEPSEDAKLKVSGRNRIDFDELMRIHDEYAKAARRVGEQTGARVIDMDEIYRSHAGKLFLSSDVIHPAQRGHNLEAKTLLIALMKRTNALRPPPVPR